MGKEEITRYKQFLLFPQCFQKTYTVNTLKPGLVWERVKSGWVLGKIGRLQIALAQRMVCSPTVFSILFGPISLCRL